MCLYVKKSVREALLRKFEKAGRGKPIVVWKALIKDCSGLGSRHRSYCWTPRVHEEINASQKPITTEYTLVSAGFHVYLTRRAAVAASTETIPVPFLAYKTNLVAAGMPSSYVRAPDQAKAPHQAVFRKLTLTRAAYDKAMQESE